VIPHQAEDPAPRKRAFEHRKRLKALLPRAFRSFVAKARKLRKRDFIPHVTEAFTRSIRERGFSDASHFWQVCRDKDKPIPQPQTTIDAFIAQR